MNKKLLILFIIIYIIFFSLFCFWKYFNFGYNGLDVAIYNQVFFNSTQGNLFQFTIHPQSYLGDHFEIFILFLLPLYYFFQSPLTLLFLQTVFLALCAWPIFLISKKLLGEKIALFVSLIWLFNPFVQNINLFEFHLLPFALFFIFFTFYFYQQKKFTPFLIFLLISLLVREDIALVMLMFGILALIEKRSLRWILSPLIISGIWFILALKLIAYFTPAGQYKFLHYYAWLGSDLQEMIKNIFLKPYLIIQRIVSWQNLFFLLGLGLPFCYLSILKPKYLLLALPIFIQMLLGGSSNAIIILDIHYVTLFLPALIIAFIYELKNILTSKKLIKVEKFFQKEKSALFLLLGLTTIYACFSLGPVWGLFEKNFSKAETLNKKTFLKEIKTNDSVATSYEFLTHLSSRENLYSLHYAYIGKYQFSEIDYSLPLSTDKLLIDTNDFLFFQLSFPNLDWTQNYKNAEKQMQKFIKENNYQVSRINDSIILLEKNIEDPYRLYEINPGSNIQNQQQVNLNNQISFLGWDIGSLDKRLNLSLYFQALTNIKKDYNLRLKIFDQFNNIIHQKNYALTYGMYPTYDWQTNEIVKINYKFLLPDNLNLENKKISFELLEQKGGLTLNRIRQVIPGITEENILGEFSISL